MSYPLIKEYLGGAAIAFGLILLSQEVIYLLFEYINNTSLYSNLQFSLLILIHILSSSIGGYLVIKDIEDKELQAGQITAILTYIIEVLHNIIFKGTSQGNLWILLSLLFGGLVGAGFIKNYLKKS